MADGRVMEPGVSLDTRDHRGTGQDIAQQRATRTRPYQMCTRCVMDTSDPEIEFSSDGTCNHCRRYALRVRDELREELERRQALSRIVERIKRCGRGREYDCLVGVSGGVDSTMVAYVAKQLGLRPLAVHFDNGWNSELAVANVEVALKKLDIDLRTHVMDWEEFRELQLAFVRASVINWEIPTDHAIVATLYRTAASNGIRYILGGGNVVTEAIMPFAWVYDAKDWKHIKSIYARFGSSRRLRRYPHFTLLDFASWTFLRGIRQIPLLNYVRYVKEEALQLLQRELGYREYGGKHYESIYTRFYQGCVLREKFMVDKRRAHFSTLINSGQMTREDALRAIQEEPYPKEKQDEDKRFVIKKLGLTKEEFDEILRRAPVPHTAYPSNSRILHGMPGVVSWVKRVATAR